MGEATTDILQPQITITPQITTNESKILLERIYGITVKKIIELNAYDDKNYKVIAEEYCDNKYISKISENGYVFKIMNKFESKKVQFVEAQRDMMLFLRKHNIKCTKPIQNKNGNYHSLEKVEGSGEHIIRLLEFIPGELFCNVPPTPQLFYNAGEYLANIDVTLKNFYHDAYKTYQSIWMLESVPEIRKCLYIIENKDDVQMIEEIILEFESKVLRNMGALEKGCIHGDFNEQNIIVKQKNNGVWFVDAILDFGDTQYACLLFELAVGLTYMIIQGKDIKMGGYFLAGYSTKRPIPKNEYALLKVCTAARFCQSLVYGAYFNSLNPNNKYILSTQNVGWSLLRKLWKTPDENLLEDWNNVIESYKNNL